MKLPVKQIQDGNLSQASLLHLCGIVGLPQQEIIKYYIFL
jgi:hypothetical protein